MSGAFDLTVDEKGIARLVFDLPGEKVNKLSTAAINDFRDKLDELSENKMVKALVLTSAKPGIFIAGADISEINGIKDSKDALYVVNEGHKVLNRFESLPFPTIAVINGVCLGGGTELALACTYRVAADSSKTSIGLPEVSLGIIPGWGGTQRLPTLVGLQNSLPIILSGKPVNARKAAKIRLVDGIFSPEFLDRDVEAFVEQCLDPKGKKKILAKRERKGVLNFLLEGNPLGRFILFKKVRRDLLKKTKGNFPAPLAALDVVEATFTSNLEDGLKKEAEVFSTLAGTAISKHLIKLFFTSQELKKDSGVPVNIEMNGSTISQAAVLGAGVMGGGIAWLFSYKDYPVRVKDIGWDAIAKGYETAEDYYRQMVKIRKLTPGQAKLKRHRISGTTDFSGFQHSDVVVEAIVEDLDIKKKVLKDLETHIPEKTIICSNTSALSISEMGNEMKHPERLVGMHFFNPVNRMPLVEIIPGEKTSPETVAKAVALTKKLGKTALVVKNCPGFLVNRILIPSLNEALLMFEEGIDVERIDKIMLDFGMPMGTFHLVDEVGLDVAVKTALTLEKAYGTRMKVPEIAKTLSGEHLYGKKVGKGFYLYEKKKKERNLEVNRFVKAPSGGDASISDKTILDRALYVMINEAARCIEEDVIDKPEYLDMGVIMGTGFPPFRGGILQYADEVGIANAVNKLRQLSMEYGKRFTPCDLLVSMSRENKTFYEGA